MPAPRTLFPSNCAVAAVLIALPGDTVDFDFPATAQNGLNRRPSRAIATEELAILEAFSIFDIFVNSWRASARISPNSIFGVAALTGA